MSPRHKWMPVDLASTTSPDPRDVSHNRTKAIKVLLDGGFPYSKTLRGHTSCVNSLTYSNNGRWLASAGDDPHVLLWDLYGSEGELQSPSGTFSGHKRNVFALAFSASDRFLYSGDTSDAILKYDVSYLSSSNSSLNIPGVQTPVQAIRRHTDTVTALSCHPAHDDVFLSASEDGTIILHDSRVDGAQMTPAQGTLQHDAEFTGVQYHPIMHHIFATSDNRGQVCLRDIRMAFGPLTQRSQDGIVRTYITTLSKLEHHKSITSDPRVSSITFDGAGSKLAVTFYHYYPTIYAVSDRHPVAICSGKLLPDGSPISPGERTWSNSCTIKHGSFGGAGLPEDRFYCAGSDDFRGYIWKVPDVAELLERRLKFGPSVWGQQDIGSVAFFCMKTHNRSIPVELSRPHYRLTGHRSIVNTVLMHPHLPYVATAGIERNVILHSPTPCAPYASSMQRTPCAVRALPGATPESQRQVARAMGLGGGPESENSDDDMAIALFDHILREEGNGDTFGLRRWHWDELEEPETDEDGDVPIA